MAILTRRTFLILGGASGAVLAGGLAVGAGYLHGVDVDGPDGAIGPDGRVSLNA